MKPAPSDAPSPPVRWVLVMGVAGCGKSALGQALAQSRGLPFIEGDAFHPAANLAKMRLGQPLTDADRADWLALLGQQLAAHPGGAVLACSALKRSYRDRLRAAVPHLLTLHLALSPAESLARVAARTDHFYPTSLVSSQFEALQDPSGELAVLTLDATRPLVDLLATVPIHLPV